MEPANAVIESATRNCTSDARFSRCLMTTGLCGMVGSSLGILCSLRFRDGFPPDILAAACRYRAHSRRVPDRGRRMRLLVEAEGGDERLLRHLYPADLLHLL